MPLFEIFFLLLAYTATSAKTRRLINIAHFAVLMLLVLTEHPCEREHDTLLADGVFVPRTITRFLSHVFVVKTERAKQVLDVELLHSASPLLKKMPPFRADVVIFTKIQWIEVFLNGFLFSRTKFFFGA